jgi:hypothetical protein
MSPLMMRLFALAAIALATSMQLKARAGIALGPQAQQPPGATSAQGTQP